MRFLLSEKRRVYKYTMCVCVFLDGLCLVLKEVLRASVPTGDDLENGGGTMSIKDKGQITRTSCTRCGSSMLKWERWPKELEVTNPYPFEGVCGGCLTQEEVDAHYGRRKGTDG